MNSVFNEILFDDKLSSDEIVDILRKQFLTSEIVENAIRNGSFGSSLFDNDRKRLYEECESEYSSVIWSELREESKRDLHNAYFYSVFNKTIEDDETTPLIKLSKTVENEFRYKIFLDFTKIFIGNKIVISGNNSDYIFDKCINKYVANEKIILTLGQMLIFVKESSFGNSKSLYAHKLRDFFENNKWNIKVLYSKEVEDFYLYYPDKYRNDSHHEYVYDEALTNECKKDTKDILTWLILSFIGEND